MAKAVYTLFRVSKKLRTTKKDAFVILRHLKIKVLWISSHPMFLKHDIDKIKLIYPIVAKPKKPYFEFAEVIIKSKNICGDI